MKEKKQLQHIIEMMNKIENCNNSGDNSGVTKWFAYLQGYIKGIQQA